MSGSVPVTITHYGATMPFRRSIKNCLDGLLIFLVCRLLSTNEDNGDMSQLANGERKLFRSLAGSPEMDDTNTRTLGTIKGVFAPVSLSMFSALLFLRMGYIVGNAGFLETVLLFSIAYIILVSTVFSICAIATNGAVKTGGVYFMLSRTMGAEFGGAVGILFYFANVVGSALYVTACVEGFLNSFGETKGAFIQEGAWGFPGGPWWTFLYCSAFNFANLCLCLIGAELFGKFSLTILVLVSNWCDSSFSNCEY